MTAKRRYERAKAARDRVREMLTDCERSWPSYYEWANAGDHPDAKALFEGTVAPHRGPRPSPSGLDQGAQRRTFDAGRLAT